MLRGGKEVELTVALEAAPETAARRDRHRLALAVPRRDGRQPVAGARRGAAPRCLDAGRRRSLDVERRLAGAELGFQARRHGRRGQRREDRRDRAISSVHRASRAGAWRVTIMRGGQQITATVGG